MASWAGGILVGTAWGLLIASPLSGVIGSLDTNGQPTSPVMALRGYAAAVGALSDALAASDDTFDLAWADGDAGWEQIEVAANASAAIIDAALAAFAADHPRSRELHERASRSMLGGVPMNWMVKWAGPYPLFVESAAGAHFRCVDGHDYVDLCLGDTGAMAGHGPAPTLAAAERLRELAADGLLELLTGVHAAAGGFKESGPWRDRPAYDDVIQGMAGTASLYAHAHGDPQYIPMAFADKLCGVMLASAIGMALFRRERTGRGEAVHLPMYETVLNFNLLDHMWTQTLAGEDGGIDQFIGYPRTLSPHRKPYPTKDGYICLLATTDQQWRRLFAAFDRPEFRLQVRGDPEPLDQAFEINPARALGGM